MFGQGINITRAENASTGEVELALRREIKGTTDTTPRHIIQAGWYLTGNRYS